MSSTECQSVPPAGTDWQSVLRQVGLLLLDFFQLCPQIVSALGLGAVPEADAIGLAGGRGDAADLVDEVERALDGGLVGVPFAAQEAGRRRRVIGAAVAD